MIEIKESKDKVRVFYSREWKSWGVQRYDKAGNQVGECTWVSSKPEAQQEAKDLKKIIENEVDNESLQPEDSEETSPDSEHFIRLSLQNQE